MATRPGGKVVTVVCLFVLLLSPTNGLPTSQERAAHEHLRKAESTLLQVKSTTETGIVGVDDALLVTGLSLFFTGLASEISRSLLRRRQGKMFKAMQDEVSTEIQKMCNFVVALHNRQFITNEITQAVYHEKTKGGAELSTDVTALAAEYLSLRTKQALSVTQKFIVTNCEFQDGTHPMFARIEYSESDEERIKDTAKSLTREGIQIGASQGGSLVLHAIGVGMSSLFIGVGALSTTWSVSNLVHDLAMNAEVLRTQEHIMNDAKIDMRYKICNVLLEIMSERDQIITTSFEFQKELREAELSTEQWGSIGGKVRHEACASIEGWCESLESLVKAEIEFLKPTRSDETLSTDTDDTVDGDFRDDLALVAEPRSEGEPLRDELDMEIDDTNHPSGPSELDDDPMLKPDAKNPSAGGESESEDIFLQQSEMNSEDGDADVAEPSPTEASGDDYAKLLGVPPMVSTNPNGDADLIISRNKEDSATTESDGDDASSESTAEISVLDTKEGILRLYEAMQKHHHIQDFVVEECSMFVEAPRDEYRKFVVMVIGTYDNDSPPDEVFCSFKNQLTTESMTQEMKDLVNSLSFKPVNDRMEEVGAETQAPIDCSSVLERGKVGAPVESTNRGVVPMTCSLCKDGSLGDTISQESSDLEGIELSDCADCGPATRWDLEGTRCVRNPGDYFCGEEPDLDGARIEASDLNPKPLLSFRNKRVPARLWQLKIPLELSSYVSRSHVVEGSNQLIGLRQKAITNVFLMNEIPNPRASEQKLGKKRFAKLKELEMQFLAMLEAGWLPVKYADPRGKHTIPENAASIHLASAFDFNYTEDDKASNDAMIMLTTRNNGVPISDLRVGDKKWNSIDDRTPERPDSTRLSYVKIDINANGKHGDGLHLYYHKEPILSKEVYNRALHSLIAENNPEVALGMPSKRNDSEEMDAKPAAGEIQ